MLLAPSLDLDDWSTGQVVGCIFGVAGGVVVLYALFLLPYLYRKLTLEDWTLKPYHLLYGPLLWNRGEVPERPEGVEVVKDYYENHKTKEEVEATSVDAITPAENDEEKLAATTEDKLAASKVSAVDGGSSDGKTQSKSLEEHEKESLGPWYTPRNLFVKAKYYFFRGVDRDVVAEQTDNTKSSFLTGDLSKKHMHTEHYDNKVEHLYSFLQVLTAAVASFAHGSNDVSNAIGPLCTIYLIWHSGALSDEAPVPIWVLVFGGVAIVIGLWTYGYNMMRNLGNRLTLHSPSRGFCMELGSAITVILASRFSLPVSTTQCITGATVAVGLCTGTWRAINWRMVGWIYGGWIFTLPVAGIISGCIMGFIINAPRWSGIPIV
jgi:sodium-dependent phosphate transporter